MMIFIRAERPGGEAELVDALRGTGAWLPEFSLVAVQPRPARHRA